MTKSSNPFLRSAEEAISRNRLLAKNQRIVNEVSKQYFTREIQKVEHPPIATKIVKAIETASNKAVTRDEFISKQLANRAELTERGLMMNEDRDALSIERKDPALLGYVDVPKISYEKPLTLKAEKPLTLKAEKVSEEIRMTRTTPVAAGFYNDYIKSERAIRPFVEAFSDEFPRLLNETTQDKIKTVRKILKLKGLYTKNI